MRQGSGSGPLEITRREALKLGATLAGAAAVGCGGDTPGTPDEDGGGPPQHADAAPGAADAGAPDAPLPSIDASQPDATDPGPPDAAAPDAAPPLTPDQLLAPIDTFVVLCMENRSYDHYLGARKLLEGLAGDGLDAAMHNPAPSGPDVPVFHLTNFTPADPPHAWDPVHAQWNMGAMDGFVKAHAGFSQNDVMGYYNRADIPVTWAFADAFTSCDRWFCSVLGPTWPNRFYLHGATSMGQTGNAPAQNFVSLFSRVAAAGKTQKNYFSDVAWAVGGYGKFNDNANIQQFFTDAQQGVLPNFSIIDPAFFAAANDDHPAHDVRLGQALIGSVYAALRQSPQWNRCLLVVTYDEHGGFFDHVPPPVCVDERPDFRRLGMRVPSMVAGPYVRRNQVVSTVFEHASIAATVTRRFGLQPLNDRATASADLSSCIDPALIGNPQPGPALPAPPPVHLTALAEQIRRRVGSRPEAHGELWDMAERGLVPRHLDLRGRALETTIDWLKQGERLGAVTLR